MKTVITFYSRVLHYSEHTKGVHKICTFLWKEQIYENMKAFDTIT